MTGLLHYLLLSGILFSISVAGIFLNRKNVILLLMCIELLLLAVNFNFIAFSRYHGDITGQIFVFFILTVAAAESAIGLAILVALFRNRRSINVEDLDTLMRRRSGIKIQNIRKQVEVRREDRVRLVKMKSEKKP